MDDAIPIWLEYADGDLSTAEFLYDQQWPRQLEIICYHCQQAGEKAVKALYLAAELPGGIPKKHDLWFLLEQMKGRVNVPESIVAGTGSRFNFFWRNGTEGQKLSLRFLSVSPGK